jgi:prepilin-type N-terminal cleavage/methylation domain-containing protein/prepilin-type processing-associated H-X9-DG protein
VKNRGFSLVELLVVIAIICLLLALFIPLLWGVRNAAKITWCQSNMRQIFLGLMSYSVEYNGYLPYTKVYNYWPDKKDWVGYWAPPEHDANAPHEGTLWQYVGVKEVYLCPADSKTRQRVRLDGYAPNYWYRNTRTTHSYSLYTYNNASGDVTLLSKYKEPSQYAFIIDESAVTIEDGNFHSGGNVFASRHRYSVYDMNPAYDKAGGNITFLDGHARFFHAEDVYNAANRIFKDFY